ncbi:MAG TPA: glycosyltransferase family 87 protein [Caulobacteraceae bacterium]|jgi:hypothetical protein
MRVQAAPALPEPPAWLPRAWPWARAIILLAAIAYLANAAWSQVDGILRFQPLGIDFMPMWAAAHEAFVHPKRIYDFTGLTRFEHPLLAHFHGMRPFVYPPPALLLFAPFGQAPFVVANAVWTSVGLVALLAALATRLKAQRVLILLAVVLSPASVLVLLTGQVTFLIAALGVTGLLCLKDRPILAGVLFGLAGVIKPQAMILLPVALIALGQWRALAAAAAAAIAAAALSVLVFGLQAWTEWLAAVPVFERMVMDSPSMERGMITPTALGVNIHLDPAALIVWRLGFAVGAVAMVWRVFRGTEDPARRLTALFGGGLFITPYAMHYDAALLAPAAALILTRRSQPGAWIMAMFAGALLCCAAIPHWGAAAVTAFVLLVALTPQRASAGEPRPPQPVSQPEPEPGAAVQRQRLREPADAR